MVPSVTQTKSRLSPRGWFTPDEEKILVNRLLRDDPSKSTMDNRQGVRPKMLWKALCDYNVCKSPWGMEHRLPRWMALIHAVAIMDNTDDDGVSQGLCTSWACSPASLSIRRAITTR